MHGAEKKQGVMFKFDLETEMKSDPKRTKELIAKSQENVQTIKRYLREGTDEKEFERLTTLLHGYTALQKVLKKATN